MNDLRSGGRPREVSSAVRTTARPLPPRPAPARPIAAGDVVADPDPIGPARAPAARKPRPDPGPIRIAVGLTGIATASALITVFLGPATGTNAGDGAGTTVAAVAAPSQEVRHITRYVQLKPGQTAPPKAIVEQAPAPKPRVIVVTTKQSGK